MVAATVRGRERGSRSERERENSNSLESIPSQA